MIFMWENQFDERTDSPIFQTTEKIEKVSDFCNNGHKNICYCYGKGVGRGGVVLLIRNNDFQIALSIKCMDRTILLVRGTYLAPLSLLW